MYVYHQNEHEQVFSTTNMYTWHAMMACAHVIKWKGLTLASVVRCCHTSTSSLLCWRLSWRNLSSSDNTDSCSKWMYCVNKIQCTPHTHCFLLVSSWLVSCQWISWSVHWSLPQVAIGSSQHLVDLPSVGSCDNEDKYHASLHPPLFSPSSLPLLLPSLCVCVCVCLPQDEVECQRAETATAAQPQHTYMYHYITKRLW